MKKRTPPLPIVDPNIIGGLKQASLGSRDAHQFLWTGHILHVDSETMVCSISLNMGAAKEWHDVPLPAPAGAGPRSWAGCVPEKGSKVLISWIEFGNRNFRPEIVGFLTPGVFPARQYEPFSAVDPEEARQALEIAPELADDPRYFLGVVRLKARKAYSGDFLASSSSGSDFLLDRDATIQNRAGNEFRLRDSDQTSVLQTINEFISSGSGFYRRGLIRRNAFNLLPDLMLSYPDRVPGTIDGQDIDEFLNSKVKQIQNEDGTWSTVLVDQINTSSPAFSILNQFGLVDSTGKVTIPDQTDPVYPFIVTPDGRRQSYIVHGTHDKRFDETDECYVEDRSEIFHTHDGVMSVTEEGDGIQVDNALKRVFIEDVKGTVVGNDPYTDAGRALYARVLSMSMFKSVDDMEKPQTELFAVDTAQRPALADSIALARLFKVKPPTTDASSYVFGITKEGRVFWNVPAAKESLQSVDINTDGGVKAFLGSNSDRVSLNLKTLGGIKLDIGSFKDDSSDDQDSVSVDVTFHGKIKTNYVGLQGRETIVNGTEYLSVGGYVANVGNGHVVVCGGNSALEAEGLRQNVGTGGMVVRSLGSYDLTCLDQASESFARPKITTTYSGSTKTTVLGVDATTVISGSYTTSVAAGLYAVTVGAGNLSLTCGTNMTSTSGANMAAFGGGAVSSIAGGSHSTVAGGTNSMVGSIAAIAAPMVKIGLTVVGNVVAGVPGPPGPHIDYITGLPITGIPTAFIGP